MKKQSKAKGLRRIKNYRVTLLTSKLKKQKSLSLIFLDLSEFEKLQQKYGAGTFKNIHSFIKKHLIEASGSKNFFRRTDELLQDKNQKNHFYILLAPSRQEAPIVKPGKLKEISLRIEKSLEKKLWTALDERDALFSSLKTLPHIRVGHSSALSSLGKELEQTAHELVDAAKRRALLRSEERKIEEKELIQYMIAHEGLLEAHYQGIFLNQKLPPTPRDNFKQNKKALFAFEALIRVNSKNFKKELSEEEASFLNLKSINPEVLFEMAKNTNLELELDFKCIEEALRKRPGIKNTLFINILPRNFYLIEKIQKTCPANLTIYFEISETEAIENFELVKKLRSKIKKHNFLLAIDDFGQGHSNFARVLGLKPDLIKLDRVLIENIHKSPLKKNFVIALQKSLNTSKTLLLAEGVEIKEELEELKKIGIPLIQGYLTQKPTSPAEIKKKTIQKKK